MTFQQMQYVLEVYRAGSVSAAAKKLFVGQPSISLTISSLEKELGYPVFQRMKNGVVPTPRGREVINQAARIWDSYQIITRPEKQGPSKICISGGSAEFCRKAAMRLVEENADRRDVYFQFANTGRLPEIQQVALFEIDLWLKFAFTQQMHILETQFRSKELKWIELAEFPFAMHIGPGHRLYNAEHIDPSMLKNDCLIDTQNKSMATSPIVNSVIPVRPDRVLAVEHPLLRKELLENGFGYTVQPVMPYEIHRLRRIPLGNLSSKLIAIYNPARPMRPEVARYLELVREEIVSFGK